MHVQSVSASSGPQTDHQGKPLVGRTSALTLCSEASRAPAVRRARRYATGGFREGWYFGAGPQPLQGPQGAAPRSVRGARHLRHGVANRQLRAAGSEEARMKAVNEVQRRPERACRSPSNQQPKQERNRTMGWLWTATCGTVGAVLGGPAGAAAGAAIGAATSNWTCPVCGGSGTYTVSRREYRPPKYWRAGDQGDYFDVTETKRCPKGCQPR
jgi:hypothetical protein